MDSVVVATSPRMRAVFDFLPVIGNSESTVLVTGESGTGKKLTVTLIHQNSRRRDRPFVVVSCRRFSETLLESELFGHERGPLLGAATGQPGRFEMAEGGTIFLDDIDDLPLSTQVTLLRVLQSRAVARLGGTWTMPINVRVIAGTKRDLQQLVAEGKFREDLYRCLNVVPVMLPPLRERPEDVPALMKHFIERYFRQRHQPAPIISDAVTQAFTRRAWPGNVRELEQACEHFARTCSGGAVPVETTTQLAMPSTPALPPAVVSPAPISLEDRLREFEAGLIVWALTVSRGNKSKAAALLRIKRSTLGDRINRCGVEASSLMEGGGYEKEKS